MYDFWQQKQVNIWGRSIEGLLSPKLTPLNEAMYFPKLDFAPRVFEILELVKYTGWCEPQIWPLQPPSVCFPATVHHALLHEMDTLPIARLGSILPFMQCLCRDRLSAQDFVTHQAPQHYVNVHAPIYQSDCANNSYHKH